MLFRGTFGSPVLISFDYICVISFSSSVSVFFFFLVESTSSWGIEINLSVCKIKQCSYPRFLGEVCRGGLLLELLDAEYLRKINMPIFLSH